IILLRGIVIVFVYCCCAAFVVRAFAAQIDAAFMLVFENASRRGVRATQADAIPILRHVIADGTGETERRQAVDSAGSERAVKRFVLQPHPGVLPAVRAGKRSRTGLGTD